MPARLESERGSVPKPTGAARGLATALCVALGLLASLELAVRWWRAGRPAAHSYSEPRNPNFRRGWVPYTAPRGRPDGVPLIVVLSNSQGFLREQDDGSLAYPSRLAAALREHGIEAIVANWSVPAGQGPEMVLLAARAAQHVPDLVVLSSGSRAFGAAEVGSAPLGYWLSDVPDLAYEPAVRRRLPRAFLVRSQAYDAMGFLRSQSALVGLRSVTEPREGNWTWRTTPQRRCSPRIRLGLQPPDRRVLRTLLSEVSAALRPEGEATPILLVNMPICRDAWRQAAYRRTRALSVEAGAVFDDDPRTTVLDARAVVADEHFTTGTHMTPAGHQIYADWLLPHVLEILGEQAARN